MATCRTHDCKEVTLNLRLPIHLANGTLQFKWILSSNNQERLRKGHSGTLHRYLPLGHRLKQCRLGSGSGPIDFVYQKNLCKERALPENKFVVALIEVTDTGDVGGKQIGCSLHALECRTQ